MFFLAPLACSAALLSDPSGSLPRANKVTTTTKAWPSTFELPAALDLTACGVGATVLSSNEYAKTRYTDFPEPRCASASFFFSIAAIALSTACRRRDASSSSRGPSFRHLSSF